MPKAKLVVERSDFDPHIGHDHTREKEIRIDDLASLERLLLDLGFVRSRNPDAKVPTYLPNSTVKIELRPAR